MEKRINKKPALISINNIADSFKYSTISNYIVSDGVAHHSSLSVKYPAVMGGIAFIFCIKGAGRVKINTQEHHIKGNMLLTILPGSICEIVDYSEDVLIEFLFFSIDFTYDMKIPGDRDIFEKMFLSPILQLTDEQFSNILDFHSFIIKQYKKENHLYRELLAQNLLAAFLTEMCNMYNESDKAEAKVFGRKREIYQQFRKLLLENIKKERTVQFYANAMCLSPKYLSQLIKEISGRPIMAWINELTIVTIKAMLKTSTMTILQISEKLNFPNPSFFGRYFKKHTGMTPVQYRES